MCTDGTVFVIRAAVRGQLVETNERLVAAPTLLHTHTSTDGYVAVVLPKARERKDVFPQLVPLPQYLQTRELGSSLPPTW